MRSPTTPPTTINMNRVGTTDPSAPAVTPRVLARNIQRFQVRRMFSNSIEIMVISVAQEHVKWAGGASDHNFGEQEDPNTPQADKRTYVGVLQVPSESPWQ